MNWKKFLAVVGALVLFSFLTATIYVVNREKSLESRSRASAILEDEAYGAIDALVWNKPDGTQTLQQSLVDINGQDSWYRKCPIDPVQGVLWSDCGDWVHVNLRATRGGSNEAYGAIDSLVYINLVNNNRRQMVKQSLVDINGQDSWYRDCPIDPAQGVLWSDCGDWVHVDLRVTRGGSNEAYGAIDSLVWINSSGMQTLQQSLVDIGGQDSWYRKCPIDPVQGVLWSDCGDWVHVDLRVTRGGSNEAYGAIDTLVWNKPDGTQTLQQSLVDIGGQDSWYRKCPIDPAQGVLWSDCGDWVHVNLRATRGGEEPTVTPVPPTVPPTVPPIIPGDYDGNGCVDLGDYNTFLTDFIANYGESGDGDYNGDGLVSLEDYNDFLTDFIANYGSGCLI